jgi:DNA-binding XRE family transcriptional regulator
MDNFLLDMLMEDSYIKELTSTEQYEKSLIIIQKKIQLSFNQFEMAAAIGVDFDTYLDMESGYTTISLEEYDKAIKRISEIERRIKKRNVSDENLIYF